MTRAFTATFTALCLAGSMALPVLADDATTADANANATTTSASATVPADANAATTVPNATAVADKTGADANSTNASTDNNDKKSLADNSAPAAAATDPNAKTPAKPAKSGSGASVGLPARVAGFTAGVIVGTPICIIRRTHLEIKQGEHDLIGDVDTWWKKGLFVFPGLLMAVPYGGISGGVGGCMYSVKNAWTNSKDEPFSKDTFSLGDVGN